MRPHAEAELRKQEYKQELSKVQTSTRYKQELAHSSGTKRKQECPMVYNPAWLDRKPELRAAGGRILRRQLLTIMVTASASPLNPSTAVISELVLSLRLLSLPPQTPVLLAHDGPRISADATDETPSAFPPRYLQYLSRLEALAPRMAACTGLDVRLVLRATNGNLAGNLAFALSLVRTPFVLKAEHDHIFVRRLPVLDIVRDMLADRRLRYVRFNRRANIRKLGDDGAYVSHHSERPIAQALWGNHEPLPGQVLHQNYTRTVCFSDMNHLTPTAYYREQLLPVMLSTAPHPPETAVQRLCSLARHHSHFGTYIFGGIDAPPAIAHLDAALHGAGELLPEVRRWLRGLKANMTRIDAPPDEPPFQCRETRFAAAYR